MFEERHEYRPRDIEPEVDFPAAAEGGAGALQRLARGLWPFWLFKDASRGDLYARAAARRHNRRMRDSLPRYLIRWLIVCCLATASIFAFDAMASDVGRHLDVFVVMAAGSGIVCAYALCTLCIIGYAYVHLGRSER